MNQLPGLHKRTGYTVYLYLSQFYVQAGTLPENRRTQPGTTLKTPRNRISRFLFREMNVYAYELPCCLILSIKK